MKTLLIIQNIWHTMNDTKYNYNKYKNKYKYKNIKKIDFLIF